METDHCQAAQRRHTTLYQGDALATWCARWLGARPMSVLFEVAHLSIVTGLRLADGREVVIKARPPTARLQACVHVQRHLWAAGFPCPGSLAGPHPLGTLTATAEALVPGGTRLAPGADSPRLFAEALAELVRLTPPVTALSTLAPPLAWVFWDHDAKKATCPAASASYAAALLEGFVCRAPSKGPGLRPGIRWR
jgi:hypothetical protein